MTIDIKVPSPGESITEVQISNWLVKNGDFVEIDQEIAEIESDKATLTLAAEDSGIISILVNAGELVKVGSVVAKIETDNNITSTTKAKKTELIIQSPIFNSEEKHDFDSIKITPLAKKVAEANHINESDLKTLNKKVQKEDVLNILNKSSKPINTDRLEERKKLSMLRKKLSERLVAVKNQTAMLTTFNEIDMSKVIEIRKKYKEVFFQKNGVKLGFMSFFTKAVTQSLQKFPEVNSYIDGDEIIYHNYSDIGVAVQTDKGLMVPILRNAEKMNLAEIEKTIATLAEKGRTGKITIDEMTGGTFTISNGGIFGSLMSTPILNPPQSAILGMHNIVERPVAINGKVVIRPMMYVALSYDHRIIDGRDSVGFLINIKNCIENPEELM
ncbi:MAG: 2-oxoglutarate dehydrogenase [Bacteroidetes bacterium GWA2_30_7]|nr:MAG: 2-oxoglutarate dehydrogenase [Bacteroidetes bacterium GWA2_30_7]